MLAPRRLQVLVLLGVLVVVWPAIARSADVQSLLPRFRLSRCAVTHATAGPWRHNGLLDAAAARWSAGEPLRRAVEDRGYQPAALGALHIAFAGGGDRIDLGRDSCAVLFDRTLKEAGLYRRGQEYWLVFASRAELPDPDRASAIAQTILRRVNEARSRSRLCGSRRMPGSAPLRLSEVLSSVAAGHADEMARHRYLEHRDLKGGGPADRVRRTGYRELLVGENIASGPVSADEVVAGWLASPAHCENLMEPRFEEMGIAFARSRSPVVRIYWVQMLAQPR